MKIRFNYAAISDVGMVRKNNEDNIYILNEKLREPKKEVYYSDGTLVQDKAMFFVCDGMGGHNAGEVASYMAVQSIKNNSEKIMSMIKRKKDIKNVFYKYISNLNDSIYDAAEENVEFRSMGTTIVGLYFINGSAYFINVGDSRAYYLNKNKLTLLTVDHADSENKHALTRFLGMSSEYGSVYPDVSIKKTNIGFKSRFLLCSDGLTDMVDESVIQNILVEEKELKKAAKRLVEAAKKNGGRDNITVIVIEAIPVNKIGAILKNKVIATGLVLAILAAGGVGYWTTTSINTNKGSSLVDLSNDIKNAKDLKETIDALDSMMKETNEKVEFYNGFTLTVDESDMTVKAKNDELKQCILQFNDAKTQFATKADEIKNGSITDEEKYSELKKLIEGDLYKNLQNMLSLCETKMVEVSNSLKEWNERKNNKLNEDSSSGSGLAGRGSSSSGSSSSGRGSSSSGSSSSGRGSSSSGSGSSEEGSSSSGSSSTESGSSPDGSSSSGSDSSSDVSSSSSGGGNSSGGVSGFGGSGRGEDN